MRAFLLMTRNARLGKLKESPGRRNFMHIKSKTEVDVAPKESEHPKRPWVTPGFARLDLTNAQAPPKNSGINSDGHSGT
jgi:hypothetical protein